MAGKSFSILPAFLVLATVLGVLFYLVGTGFEKFFFESWGTLLLSPVIYVRILPDPIDAWLLRCMSKYPVLQLALCAMPVLILAGAALSGAIALWQQSTLLAFGCLALVALVFAAYHWMQPFGLTLVTIFH